MAPADLEAATRAAPRDAAPEPWVGRPLRRIEDARLVAGAGGFVDDHRPAGCLHVAFARSPHARARIVALDLAAARGAPGVALVVGGADLAAVGGPAVNPIVPGLRVPSCPVLAVDEVCAVGEAFAAVVAATPDQARDAAELIAATFAPRDAVADPATAAGAPAALPDLDANTAFAQEWRAGDVDGAFARAAAVATVTLAQPRVAALSLEPRAILASWDDVQGTLTVQLSTQTPHRARAEFARLLGLDRARVRVRARDVGGAFGAKASVYPEEIAVAWLAKTLRRAIKWIATRGEDMLAASHGRGGILEGELALAADGTMLGLRARIAMPLGRWLTYSAAVPAWNAGRILPGPYRTGTVDIAIAGLVANTAAVGIYRGAGRPEAAMLMERLVDDGARRLAIDPMALRRRNLIPAEAMPWRTATGQVLDSGDFAALLDRACAAADYAGLRQLQMRRRARGDIVGIGTALYVEPCGNGWEAARIRIGRDGIATVGTGAAAQGQGRETAFAQIAADALGVDAADIRIVCGDSDATADGVGALASRSTAIGGSAVARAAEMLIAQAVPLAATLLQCRPDEVAPAAGGFALRSRPDRRIAWAALADAAGGTLEAAATFTVDGETWASGCCIAAVAIDRDTGVPTIERLVWADDAGTIVNPLLAEGQLVGGLAQGLGQALLERLVYDDAGQLLTGSLMDYAIPRAADLPPVTIVKSPTRAATNPLGAKGVGEAGCIGIPAAIVNAAVDALAPFGVRHLDVPLTSESLWRAMNATPQRDQAGTGKP
ncbi:MAG: xanthine dehydrogenase family protein [Alphaproteobacteria bacterium]|nr:xanthine dehydrogenase family protein [Alphaproteobacteria bacterium]